MLPPHSETTVQPQPPRALNSRWAPLNTMARSHSHNANASDGRGRCATWPSAQREAILLGGVGVARRFRGRGGGGGGGGGGGRRSGVGHIPRGRAGGELDLVKEADVIVLGEALLRVTQRLRWRGWVRGCGVRLYACHVRYGEHALARHIAAAVALWAGGCSPVHWRLRPLGRARLHEVVRHVEAGALAVDADDSAARLAVLAARVAQLAGRERWRRVRGWGVGRGGGGQECGAGGAGGRRPGERAGGGRGGGRVEIWGGGWTDRPRGVARREL